MIIGVVVTHSSPAAQLDRCLNALLADGGPECVVVVDNGDVACVPGAVDPRAADAAAIEVLRVENRGYGAAANVGIRRARELGATAVALLNDDVIVTPGWLDPLVAELGAGRVGAVQPKLVFADRRLATINSLGVTIDRTGAGHDIGFGEPDRVVPTTDIDAFTGGAVLFDPTFLDETAGFDERYFLYYEDVDLAARGARLGWRYRCVPASVVEHIGSATTSAHPERTLFLQERNRLWCAFRNADPGTIARAVWLSVRRLRHRPRVVHAKALAAALGGAPVRGWERARAHSTT